MKKISISFVSILMVLFCSIYALASPTGKVTVKVIGEDDVPIQGADARVTFKFGKRGGWGLNTKAEAGVTNNEGFFLASGSGMASISISARKEGYYKSGRGYQFTSRSKLLNRWEPWNPVVEVVLKKKRNPVAMYMKGTNWVEVPTEETSVGFDLEKGDWVTPHGKGTINDFVFSFLSDIKAYRDYDLKMTLGFSNELDGIQEYLFNSEDQSYFKWPFEAPIDGYKRELTKEIHKIPGKTETNINRSAKYILRVRTQTDNEGKIISAKYGKVSSEFEMSPDGSKFLIRFFYYFNPDGTRNLEEDPDRNLFKKERKLQRR